MKYWETLASGYDRFGGVQNVLLGVFAETESEAIGVASGNFLNNPDHLSLRAVNAYERSAEALLQAYCKTVELCEQEGDYLGNGEVGAGTIQYLASEEFSVIAAVIKQKGTGATIKGMRSNSRSTSFPQTVYQLFKLGMSVFPNE